MQVRVLRNWRTLNVTQLHLLWKRFVNRSQQRFHAYLPSNSDPGYLNVPEGTDAAQRFLLPFYANENFEGACIFCNISNGLQCYTKLWSTECSGGSQRWSGCAVLLWQCFHLKMSTIFGYGTGDAHKLAMHCVLAPRVQTIACAFIWLFHETTRTQKHMVTVITDVYMHAWQCPMGSVAVCDTAPPRKDTLSLRTFFYSCTLICPKNSDVMKFMCVIDVASLPTGKDVSCCAFPQLFIRQQHNHNILEFHYFWRQPIQITLILLRRVISTRWAIHFDDWSQSSIWIILVYKDDVYNSQECTAHTGSSRKIYAAMSKVILLFTFLVLIFFKLLVVRAVQAILVEILMR